MLSLSKHWSDSRCLSSLAHWYNPAVLDGSDSALWRECASTRNYATLVSTARGPPALWRATQPWKWWVASSWNGENAPPS